jgi:hypothetical protein
MAILFAGYSLEFYKTVSFEIECSPNGTIAQTFDDSKAPQPKTVSSLLGETSLGRLWPFTYMKRTFRTKLFFWIVP